MANYLKTDPETIALEPRSDRKYDGLASGTVRPGAVVDINGTNGEYHTFTEGYGDVKRVAIEYSHTGQDINDSYADGDHMELRRALPGESYYMLLSAGESVSAGDRLAADGSGEVRAYDGGGGDTVDMIFGEAIEAVDNSGGSSAVFIQVEVA